MQTHLSIEKMRPKNIWAIGRNYADHAKEMAAEVPKHPMVFLKSGSCLVVDREIQIAKEQLEIHHELEIALRLDQNLQIIEMGLALDLTARDIQAQAKKQGHPWTAAKSFRNSCPVSSFVAVPFETPHFEFSLSVNGELRQKGTTRDLIFDFKTIVQEVVRQFPVEPWDLILTGTPSGVGPIRHGDILAAVAKSDLGHTIQCEWKFHQS